MIESMSMPRHPAFWRFKGFSVDNGEFDGFDACARTFVAKTASYRARIASTCCFSGNADVDVVVAEKEVREVDVPREGWKSGLRRRYALREGASAVAVRMSVG